MGLSLCPVFCNIGTSAYFDANTMPFLLLLLCSIVEGSGDTPCFSLLAKDYFRYSGYLTPPNEFQDCFLYFYEEYHWDFNWNCIKFV